jgi:antitoxin ParD1/3/4
MNVSVGERWESFIEQVVSEGRYASISEVVREGLRLVEERETKVKALRDHIQAAIAEGGRVTDAELDASIEAELNQWEAEQRQAG